MYSSSPHATMVAEESLAARDSAGCLISRNALLTLSNPDAVGLLDRRSNLSGWYNYQFSLNGSQLLYFEHGQFSHRGLLAGRINLFRHKLTLVNTLKRRREFEIAEASGKVHVLRAATDAELHWWVQLFNLATRKVPPAQPISPPKASAPTESLAEGPRTTSVGAHLKVDHVLCVVHGIGVSADVLGTNTRALQESYEEIMARAFPDVEFRVELLVIHWREALTRLDVHAKLHAAVPVAPVDADANPLRQFMVHRIVDYVYYTHDRYRRQILREVAGQLNAQVEAFRKRRPDFDGEISILAHSLGAALVYDLMCRKVCDDQALLAAEGMRLEFDAGNLFCVGNPLGTLLALDRSIGLGADMMGLPFRIFNVFKYHDPLATRLEPHCDMRAVENCPVTVPCWLNMGLRESTGQWIGNLWAGRRRKGENEENGEAEGEEEFRLKGGLRVDFGLQASSAMEDMSTNWSALKAHTEYWTNRDAMLLMVCRMMKSSFGLRDEDGEEEGWDEEFGSRVVDRDILQKGKGEWGGAGVVEEGLEEAVEQVVERLVNEAVAMNELLTLHPRVRMRSGGVTSPSPTGSKIEIEINSTDNNTNTMSSSGWASYLGRGWFGRDEVDSKANEEVTVKTTGSI